MGRSRLRGVLSKDGEKGASGTERRGSGALVTRERSRPEAMEGFDLTSSESSGE
jgi:hypothetical protein